MRFWKTLLLVGNAIFLGADIERGSWWWALLSGGAVVLILLGWLDD